VRPWSRRQPLTPTLAAKGFAIDIPECLDVLGAVAATQESYREAARLLGAAAAARARLGTVRFPPEPQFWAGVERTTTPFSLLNMHDALSGGAGRRRG
jgi:hypothetical protein